MTLARKMTNMTIGPTHFHMTIHVIFKRRETGLAKSEKNLYTRTCTCRLIDVSKSVLMYPRCKTGVVKRARPSPVLFFNSQIYMEMIVNLKSAGEGLAR